MALFVLGFALALRDAAREGPDPGAAGERRRGRPPRAGRPDWRSAVPAVVFLVAGGRHVRLSRARVGRRDRGGVVRDPLGPGAVVGAPRRTRGRAGRCRSHRGDRRRRDRRRRGARIRRLGPLRRVHRRPRRDRVGRARQPLRPDPAVAGPGAVAVERLPDRRRQHARAGRRVHRPARAAGARRARPRRPAPRERPRARAALGAARRGGGVGRRGDLPRPLRRARSRSRSSRRW